MNISFPNLCSTSYKPAFCSNATVGSTSVKSCLTNTYLFREDCKWQEMADFFIHHFKDKDKVNFVQFAASDGSEAYTQIISLLETKRNVDKFFPIKAFDISDKMVSAANSGMINILPEEVKSIPSFFRYFTSTDKKLVLEKDVFKDARTYEVKDVLKNKVNFKKGDMFEILKNFKDNSESLIFCRNVLIYFDDNELIKFADMLSEKLKSGSLFVISPDDMKLCNIDTYLFNRKFRHIFDGIYRRL